MYIKEDAQRKLIPQLNIHVSKVFAMSYNTTFCAYFNSWPNILARDICKVHFFYLSMPYIRSCSQSKQSSDINVTMSGC